MLFQTLLPFVLAACTLAHPIAIRQAAAASFGDLIAGKVNDASPSASAVGVAEFVVSASASAAAAVPTAAVDGVVALQAVVEPGVVDPALDVVDPALDAEVDPLVDADAAVVDPLLEADAAVLDPSLDPLAEVDPSAEVDPAAAVEDPLLDVAPIVDDGAAVVDADLDALITPEAVAELCIAPDQVQATVTVTAGAQATGSVSAASAASVEAVPTGIATPGKPFEVIPIADLVRRQDSPTSSSGAQATSSVSVSSAAAVPTASASDALALPGKALEAVSFTEEELCGAVDLIPATVTVTVPAGPQATGVVPSAASPAVPTGSVATPGKAFEALSVPEFANGQDFYTFWRNQKVEHQNSQGLKRFVKESSFA